MQGSVCRGVSEAVRHVAGPCVKRAADDHRVDGGASTDPSERAKVGWARDQNGRGPWCGVQEATAARSAGAVSGCSSGVAASGESAGWFSGADCVGGVSRNSTSWATISCLARL